MRFSLGATMLTPVPLGGPAYWHAKGTTTIFICTLNWKIVKKPQSNLYITAQIIAVTLYITVTGQLPKIFSCLIFSAKLTYV